MTLRRDQRAERAFHSAMLARVFVFGCMCWAVPACGDDGHGSSSLERADTDNVDEAADAGPRAGSACKGASDGTRCGDEKHCIDGVCVFNTCGDGIKDGDEACDDGNAAAGDGCDPGCALEPTGCGNARVDDGEECDDGNRIDADACSNACRRNQCGNERIDVGEECDDGNTVDDDACSNSCHMLRCRNGRLDPGEECDDGNAIDDDGCTNRCRIMICGNGKQEQKEECDDGNSIDVDACSNACTANECGNGRIDPGEVCDGSLGCAQDCKSMSRDVCTECERAKCSDWPVGNPEFEGAPALHLPEGCLDDQIVEPEVWGVTDKVQPGDFSTPCKALLACVRMTRCMLGPFEQVAGGPLSGPQYDDSCLCGTADPSACLDGMADGPCLTAFEAAARTSDPAQTASRITDLSVPLGAAHYLLRCDVERCKAECTPWLQ